ncbi:hypothetical protein C0J52_23359 [Blattella germanica]|nr:hypothetical protein C0J52_23359 [Blattella germanica]
MEVFATFSKELRFIKTLDMSSVVEVEEICSKEVPTITIARRIHGTVEYIDLKIKACFKHFIKKVSKETPK